MEELTGSFATPLPFEYASPMLKQPSAYPLLQAFS